MNDILVQGNPIEYHIQVKNAVKNTTAKMSRNLQTGENLVCVCN